MSSPDVTTRSRVDIIALAIGRVLQSLILFLTYRELTHLLPKSEVGLYFFLLAITGGFGLIVINPAGTYFNRFLHRWQKNGTLTKRSLNFTGFTLLASGAAFILTAIIQYVTKQTTPYMAVAVALFVFGSTLGNTFIPALNLLRFPRRFVFFTVASQSLTLIASVYAAKLLPEASIWLGVAGVVNLIFGVIGFTLLSRLTATARPESTPPARTASYWSFAWPLMLANIGVWFLTQGYRPVAQNLFGLEALAVIGLGLGLASSIGNAFEALAQQLFLPKFYEKTHHDESASRRASWESLWSELVPMYFAIALFVTGFSAALVRVLSPTSYANAWIYLSIGAWIEFFRMSAGLVSLLTFSELSTKNTIRPFLEGALLTFSLMMAFNWIAVSILVGNIYALCRIALKMKHTASILHFSPSALKLVGFSAVFLAPVFFREHFNSISTSFIALAIAGPCFAVVLLKNSSWKRAL